MKKDLGIVMEMALAQAVAKEVEREEDFLILNEAIGRIGWAVRIERPKIRGASVSYAYSIGNSEKNKPELIISGGLSCNKLGELINYTVHYCNKHGFNDGEVLTEVFYSPIKLMRVDLTLASVKAKFATLFDYYSGSETTPNDVYQIIWSDTNGRFPDDEDCIYDDSIMEILPAHKTSMAMMYNATVN